MPALARRLVGPFVLSLLFGAVRPCSSACPAHLPEHETLWGLTAAAWTAACDEGKDPLALLEKTRTDFIAACTEAFLGALPEEPVRERCAQGRPGESALRALLKDGKSLSPGENTPPGKARAGVSAAGLSRLGAVGADASALDAAYSGAAQHATLPFAAEAALPPAQAAMTPSSAHKALKTPGVATPPRLPPAALALALELPAAGLAGGSPERRFAQSIFERMQDSEEGRAILSDLVQESLLRGRKVKVAIDDAKGTEIVSNDGVEDIEGAASGVSQPDDWTLNLNKAFLRFKDPELALNDATATAAHELYHILLRSRTRRVYPGYREVFSYDLHDEIAARLKGYIVSAQLNGGRPDGHSEEVRSLLDDPDGTWESMKLWDSGYSVSLDRSEMADPLAAYAARLEDLKNALKEAREERAALPALLRRIRHFAKTHGLAERLRDLLDGTEKRTRTVVEDIAGYREAMSDVKQRRDFLRSRAGRAELTRTKRAAADPAYGRVAADCARDLEKLRAQVVAKPLPKPTKSSGQIDLAELSALAEKDRLENPSHVPDL
ncbi:MAG: hypothetical protein WC969_14670 [Elusimicrobiota bacterium]|jgi:hypothetical protein